MLQVDRGWCLFMIIKDRLVFYPFAVICLASPCLASIFRSFQALLIVFSIAIHLRIEACAAPSHKVRSRGVGRINV